MNSLNHEEIVGESVNNSQVDSRVNVMPENDDRDNPRVNVEPRVNPKVDMQYAGVVRYGDPYMLSSGDNLSMPLTPHLFNGSNYTNWSRSIKMALIARNKLCFVDGTLRRPEMDTDEYQKWLRCDYVVMTWIINSMEKNIAESFIFIDSSLHLWREITERFGQTNVPQLYDLHRSLMSLEQGEDSIAIYYGKMKRIWDELQSLEGIPECMCGMMDACSCLILKKLLEANQRMKLIQFLSGLHKKYDQVRSTILSTDPLPTVNRAYHILQQVERQNMNMSSMTPNMNEMSAMMAHKGPAKPPFDRQKRNRYDKICDHCKAKGHSIEQCFKLIGYPEWFQGKRGKTQGNFVPKMAANVRIQSSDEESQYEDYGSTTDKSAGIDSGMINAVYKEVMKLMQRQGQMQTMQTMQSDPLSLAGPSQ